MPDNATIAARAPPLHLNDAFGKILQDHRVAGSVTLNRDIVDNVEITGVLARSGLIKSEGPVPDGHRFRSGPGIRLHHRRSERARSGGRRTHAVAWSRVGFVRRGVHVE